MSTSPYSGKTYGKGTATKTTSTPSSSTTNQSSTAPTSPQQVSMAAFQKANPGVSVSASNFDPTTGAYKGTSTITPKDVTTTPPTIPNYEQPKFDAVGNLIGSQAASDYFTNVTSQQALIDKNANNTQQMYKALFASIATPEQNLQSAKDISGMDAAQKIANEENAKLQTVIKQGQAMQQQVVGQGRGIPEVIIGGQQAQIARETAIQALPIQASLEAAQGNLAAATATFDKLFTAKQQDAQNKLQYGFKVIDTISQFASEKDKIALDYVKQQEQRKYDATIKEQDNLSKLSTTLLTFKAPSNILEKVANAKSYKEALAIPGISKYMSDPIDARLKAAQAAKLEFEASGKQNLNEVLSPKDAKDYGVPFGTTKGQLIALGKAENPDSPLIKERGLDKIDQLAKLTEPS